MRVIWKSKGKYLYLFFSVGVLAIMGVLGWSNGWLNSGISEIDEGLRKAAQLPEKSGKIELLIESGQKTKKLVGNEAVKKPVYYSITNLGERLVKPQVVINGQDWFTDRSIVDYALRGINKQEASDEERALAVLEFMIKNRYHFSPPLDGVHYSIENPVQYFNSWGYGFCSDSALVLAQLLYLAGFEARQVGITEHLVSEVFYDGAWHMLDSDREVYYRNFRGEIASIEEIVDNNQLLDSPIWLREMRVDVIKLVRKKQAVAFSKKASGRKSAEMSRQNRDYQDELIYDLKPKEEIRFYYDFKGRYYWGFKSDQPPEFTNGVLLSGNKGGYYKFRLPFPIVASYVYKQDLCKAINKVRFSRDGIDWEKITDCQDDVLNLTDLFPRGEGSYPTQQYFLVLPWSLTDYQVLTQFQTAPRSIPRLNVGVNDVAMKKVLKSDVKLEFGYWSD